MITRYPLLLAALCTAVGAPPTPVLAEELRLRSGFYQGYSADAGAHLRLQVRGNGKFTGRLATTGASATVKGQIDGAPLTLNNLPGQPTLRVFAVSESESQGRLDYNGQPGQFFAITRGFSGRGADRAPLAGNRINANLTAATSPEAIEGAGFFSAVVRPNGNFRAVGRLPDNQPLSRSLRASAGDIEGMARAPIVAAWGRQSQRQALAGEWTLRTPSSRLGNEAVLLGGVDWSRPAGGTVRLETAGGRWQRTIKGRNVLGNGIDRQRFILARAWPGQRTEQLGLMEPHPLNRPYADQPLAAPMENLLLKVNAGNGLFQGSFEQVAPDGRKLRRPLFGILTGYFRDQYAVETGEEQTETVELYGRGLIDFGEQGSGLVEIIKPPPGILPDMP